MQSRRFATVVTLVIVVAFFLVAIAPAFASPAPGTLPFHARLVSSEPADRTSVETADRRGPRSTWRRASRAPP